MTALSSFIPAGRRETVVLLHASASSARQWDALAATLRPRFDVLAIDLHGHGSGPAVPGERAFTLHDDVALARERLQAAGGGHVIGHSYGGAVAVHLAAAAPGLVRSLAVYEPVLFRLLADHARGSFGAREVFDMATLVWTLVRHGQPAQAAQRFVDYWSGPLAWQHMPPHRQQATSARMALVAQHFDTLVNTALPTAALARLCMPVLCLHGSRSTAAARQLATLQRQLLPGACHEALEGLGHMAPLTHALPVNDRLQRFLIADVPGWQQPACQAA